MSATKTTVETHELYGGEYQVSFSESSHRYKVNGDYKFSVTTALGVLSKENLIQWAANKSVDAFRLAYTAEAAWTSEEFETVCQQARYAHRTLKDDAAEVGKRVHAWISAYIKESQEFNGTPLIYCDDLMRPSVEAFLEWERQTKPEYLHSERVVYSRKHDYCGTVDLVMMIDGKRVVADLKTSKPEQEYKKTYTGRQRGRAEHFLQNGAYDQALGEEDGVWADSVAVIYLPLDGSIHVYQHDDTQFWRAGFIKVLETFRFLKDAGSVNEFREVA